MEQRREYIRFFYQLFIKPFHINIYRYAPMKLLIAVTFQLLFAYNADSIYDLTSLGSLRTFKCQRYI